MAEQIKEITQLRGLNVRQEAGDVEDPESRICVNFDPFQKPGALVIRKGKTRLQGGLPVDVVRTLAKVNSVRYQVVNKTAYRAGTAIVGPELATNKQTSVVSFRPLDDSTIWAFFADDNLMFKDDTTNTYVWGIDEPLDPGPKVANQTGKTAGDTITAGDYMIAVTQLRYDLSGR